MIKVQKIFFCVLLVMSFTISGVACAKDKHSSLEQFEWKYRLLLIDTEQVKDLEILRTQLNKVKDGLLERKLLILGIDQDQVSNLLSKQVLNIDSQYCLKRMRQRAAILIGLDGSTKTVYSISNNTVDIQQLFADIDGMPMRRAERY